MSEDTENPIATAFNGIALGCIVAVLAQAGSNSAETRAALNSTTIPEENSVHTPLTLAEAQSTGNEGTTNDEANTLKNKVCESNEVSGFFTTDYNGDEFYLGCE